MGGLGDDFLEIFEEKLELISNSSFELCDGSFDSLERFVTHASFLIFFASIESSLPFVDTSHLSDTHTIAQQPWMQRL